MIIYTIERSSDHWPVLPDWSQRQKSISNSQYHQQMHQLRFFVNDKNLRRVRYQPTLAADEQYYDEDNNGVPWQWQWLTGG